MAKNRTVFAEVWKWKQYIWVNILKDSKRGREILWSDSYRHTSGLKFLDTGLTLNWLDTVLFGTVAELGVGLGARAPPFLLFGIFKVNITFDDVVEHIPGMFC